MNCADVLSLTQRIRSNWTALRLLPNTLKLEYDDISTSSNNENGPQTPGVRVYLDRSETTRSSLPDATVKPAVLKKADLQSAFVLSPSFRCYSVRLKQVRYASVLYCRVRYGMMLCCCCTVLCPMVLCSTNLYCDVLHYTALHYTTPYFTILRIAVSSHIFTHSFSLSLPTSTCCSGLRDPCTAR